MKKLLAGVCALHLFFALQAQTIYQDDFQLTKKGKSYELKAIFVLNRLDSAKLIISTANYKASYTYANGILLDLNNLQDPDGVTQKILAAIFLFNYDSATTNQIVLSPNPAKLGADSAADSGWAPFKNTSFLFFKNRLLDIRKEQLTQAVGSGTIQIRTAAKDAMMVFGYSLKKDATNNIFVSLLEDAQMNGAVNVEGINSFNHLYGETSELIAQQLFNLIKTAKTSAIYDDEDDFYNKNVQALNDMAIAIKKLKGTFFDFSGIPDRYGFFRVAGALPVYVDAPDVSINYEKVKKHFEKSDTALAGKFKTLPFVPYVWKFNAKDSGHPNTGGFAVINKNDTLGKTPEINLADDGAGGNFFRPAKQQIATIDIDSVDVYIIDGEIYSVSFLVKHPSQLPGVGKEQLYKLRIPIKELSRSIYKLYNRDYILLSMQRLSTENGGVNYYMHPSDLLFFDHPEQLNNRIFTSIDTVFRIRSSNNQLNVTQKLREKGLLSIFDLDVFTDALGLLDANKPNGLLQSEFKFDFFGIRGPLSEQHGYTFRTYVFDKFQFRARISKIDKQNNSIDVPTTIRSTGDSIEYINPINLYRYQNMFADITANLVDLDMGNTEAIGYAKAGILRSNLRDTLVSGDGSAVTKTPNEFHYNSIKYSFGAMIRFLRTHDINIDVDCEALFLKTTSRRLLFTNSEFDEFRPENNRYVPAKNTALIWDPKLMFTYNFDRSKSRRIIGRVEYAFEKKQFGNNGLFLQIGYSADLDRFLNLNKPATANY